MGKTLKVWRALAASILFLCSASPYTNAETKEFEIQQKSISTGEEQLIELRFNRDFSHPQKQRIQQWLQHNAQALNSVYGEWPIDNLIVYLERSNSDKSPVPWGEITRSSPPSVRLVVNPINTLADLNEDWTLYHELSHLLIPYDGGGERWFSEGLASYYQNILQARIGVLDERMMWQKLFNGFERGRNQNNWQSQNLSELSRNMRRNRNYMRIYWSGALYWLEADIALRQQGSSLDAVLLKLRHCCRNDSLSARILSIKLDSLSETRVFTKLFNEFSQSHAIPDYTKTLERLGINTRFGKVSLNNEAELSEIRRAIYKAEIE